MLLCQHKNVDYTQLHRTGELITMMDNEISYPLTVKKVELEDLQAEAAALKI